MPMPSCVVESAYWTARAENGTLCKLTERRGGQVASAEHPLRSPRPRSWGAARYARVLMRMQDAARAVQGSLHTFHGARLRRDGGHRVPGRHLVDDEAGQQGQM